jgi:hypothetical protein
MTCYEVTHVATKKSGVFHATSQKGAVADLPDSMRLEWESTQ